MAADRPRSRAAHAPYAKEVCVKVESIERFIDARPVGGWGRGV